MKNLKVLIRWFIGILCLFMSFSSMILQSYTSGILFLSTALVLIPPVFAFIEETLNIQTKREVKYGLVLTGYVASMMTMNPKMPEQMSVTEEKRIVTDTVKVIVRDTIKTVVDEPKKAAVVGAKKAAVVETKKAAVVDKTLSSSLVASTKEKSSTSTPKVQLKSKRGRTSQYITGPRGGCYYINANGKKTYVDHSYCN